MPRLSYNPKSNVFIFHCTYAERNLARQAGFYFAPDSKSWQTSDLGRAARLREHADDEAKLKFNSVTLQFSPWLSPLTYPAHLTPYPFQKLAALFALERSRSYLALDPGLGKTIVAAMVCSTSHQRTVVVCPPFLTRNTEIEFKKWCPPKTRITRLEAGEELSTVPDVLIIPDSILTRPSIRDALDTVLAFTNGKALLVVDEAHRFKTPTAKRSKALYSFASRFSQVVYLSGTPMLNRPIEMHGILSHSAPETIDFMDRDAFGMKYCNGYWNQYEMDYSGASHLAELKNRVTEKFMLQIRKETVLPELPPKTESIVIIGDRPPKMIELEKNILQEHSPEDLVAGQVSSTHLSVYRHELGRLKVPTACDLIRDTLYQNTNGLIVFAYHRDVIEDLAKGLDEFEPFVITGSTPKSERHEIVKAFQNATPERRLLIGNYLACGVGLTLTRASQVVFVESSWTDAENRQAADRTHRIGQKENVYIQYLVYENSLDRKLIESCLRKRELNRFI